MLSDYIKKFKWIEVEPKRYHMHYHMYIEDVQDHVGLKITLEEEEDKKHIHSYRNRFQFIKLDNNAFYEIDDFLKNITHSTTYELYMINPIVYMKEKKEF